MEPLENFLGILLRFLGKVDRNGARGLNLRFQFGFVLVRFRSRPLSSVFPLVATFREVAESRRCLKTVLGAGLGVGTPLSRKTLNSCRKK